RTMDDFDETIDDFSLASIALSLKAISMKPTLLDTYGASDRLLFSENDYRNPSNSKVISALQELMCDKDFCTLYSLFMLALARKELSACSFRLFIGEKPILPQTIEDLSTKATDEELREAFVDEWGVKYSKDGRKLLQAPKELDGTYSIRKGTKIICDEAFGWSKIIGCRSLTDIVIPNSVTNIGDYAFSGCRSLTDIVIPDSVTNIGDCAFWDCRSLTDIVIPNSVTSIGDNAFEYCFSLSNLVIPDGVTSIGKWAFEDCSSLSSVVIPDSVTSIGNHAFAYCESLTDIVIPDSVTSIGDNAFAYCESLTDIVIPDSVTSIGDNAFRHCSSLSSVVIPKSVVNLNGNPFCRWDGELKCLSPYFIYDNKVLFDKDKSKIIAFRDKNTTSYVIPDSVTRIGESAFRGCSFLNSVVIPDGVTSIGEYAFRHCSSLSSLVIPDSVTSIECYAFSGCESLSSIVIPDSVTSIGYHAFASCNLPN
uniref:leucine-rich repeat domain-containing protein n=1 Tax=uncultured Clostridium sp. TaxID=59620 RepID=UPI0025FD8438